MRVWILSVVLAAAALAVLPSASFAAATATPTLAPSPTSPPKAQPTPTQPKATATPQPTPTSAPPTATTIPSPTLQAAAPTPQAAPPRPTPAATSPSTTPTSAAVKAAPSPAVTPEGSPQASTSPTPVGTGVPVPAAATGTLRGLTFADTDADGQLTPGEGGVSQIDLTLAAPDGQTRTTRTDDNGAFAFASLAPGVYHVDMTVPAEYVATTDTGLDVEIVQDAETPDVHFGLISRQAAGLNPDGTPNADAMDDEQIIALASVSSLPLRFAEGRDLMAQVGKRVLGDGLVWLGVPFRSQIDGGNFQYVNCGPASLTMVLAGFGLEVGPSQVRDYLNNLIDNFDTDLGTSLDVLSQIGRQAGLTPMDLYSDSGGYRNWSTDAVRWHVQQGHPVITLVKYRNLPGHSSSVSEFDHYIVISGLTPNGFIYNDAAFATTLGYGLEISDVELEYAWDNSSIPHHALAFGLDPDKKSLSFPELPRKPRSVAADAVAPARGALRLAQADEAERVPLLLTPTVPSAALASSASPAGPLVSETDQWQSDPDFDTQPPTEPGAPMGLNLEQTDAPALEARPGPGTLAPKLLSLVGLGWTLWLVWTFSGRIVRR